MATSKMYLNSAAAAILALAGFAGSAGATQTINVNFGCPGDAVNGKTFIDNNYQQAPAPYTGMTWNDYIAADDGLGGGTPATRTVNNLLDSDGNATTVGWTTATSNATPLAGPGIWYDHPPVKMLDGGLYRVTASGSGNQMRARFTVTGLNPAKTYNIYLACSAALNLNNKWGIGTASEAPATTQTVINTAATKAAQTWKPGDNWLVFYNVAPIDQGNGTGNIYVWGYNLMNAGGYSGITLNGFQVVDATNWQNSDKSIYDFAINGYPGVISDHNTGNTITVTMPSSTKPWTALAPTFTLSDNASCSPASGDTVDFSNSQTTPVDFTVTAQDGSTKVYHVTVAPSSAKDILSFTVGTNPAAIVGNEVILVVPNGTGVDPLTPTIAVSPLACKVAATSSSPIGATRRLTIPISNS